MTKTLELDYRESIYHYRQKIEKEEQIIRNNKAISKRNNKIIFEFCRDRHIYKYFIMFIVLYYGKRN